jgi:septal ring factor EnvC (AmiA/AmiB activator)
LEKELAEKKKEMARIIEISNKAYEARDAAQQEMAALKHQADKEQAEFEKEWKELGKMIEQDRKMKDFMKKEREKLSLQARAAPPARAHPPLPTAPSSLSHVPTPPLLPRRRSTAARCRSRTSRS